MGKIVKFAFIKKLCKSKENIPLFCSFTDKTYFSCQDPFFTFFNIAKEYEMKENY